MFIAHKKRSPADHALSTKSCSQSSLANCTHIAIWLTEIFRAKNTRIISSTMLTSSSCANAISPLAVATMIGFPSRLIAYAHPGLTNTYFESMYCNCLSLGPRVLRLITAVPIGIVYVCICHPFKGYGFVLESEYNHIALL